MNTPWEHSFDEGGKVAEPGRGKYNMRFATEADRAMAQAWVDLDPDHRGRMGGAYWTEQEPGAECRILYRGDKPMYFFRVERVVRVHAQFAPTLSEEERDDMRDALESGINWLSMAMGAGGVRELLFDSVSRLLRRFCLGKLGFKAEPNTLKRTLARLPPRQ